MDQFIVTDTQYDNDILLDCLPDKKTDTVFAAIDQITPLARPHSAEIINFQPGLPGKSLDLTIL